MNINYSGARRGFTLLSAVVPLLMILVLYPLSGLASASIDDANITGQVDREFHFDPAVPFHTIEVSTEAGIVTLSGDVDSWTEYKAARENAFEGGAIAVINKLEVEEES